VTSKAYYHLKAVLQLTNYMDYPSDSFIIYYIIMASFLWFVYGPIHGGGAYQFCARTLSLAYFVIAGLTYRYWL